MRSTASLEPREPRPLNIRAPFGPMAWRHGFAYGARSFVAVPLGLRLASFLSHKSHYVHSRPGTGTRSRRTPGCRVPAASRLPRLPIRRPD